MRLSPVRSDRLQGALTARFLEPALPALREMFFEIRAETDRVLGGREATSYGARYPYGYCLEITQDVLARLTSRMSRQPASAGERAMRSFLVNGGQVQRQWGVLRERFFQNALAAGTLYVDVSNDTVDVTKPKIEILPAKNSGLVPVRDGAHFARIAESYWRCRAYANTALPALAPLFPIILAYESGKVRLESSTTQMTKLFSSDGFRLSEQWLRDGREPPAAVVLALRDACPEDILARNPDTGRLASIMACRALRADRVRIDQVWIDRMCEQLLRLAPANLRGLSVTGGDPNAHIFAGVRGPELLKNSALAS